jgi:hypothetical protein
MKTYTCACGQLTFFESVTCVACGRELGFLPDVLRLSSLEPAENGLFRAVEAGAEERLYKKCQNYSKESVCNWMIPAGNTPEQEDKPFCGSCRLNETIPDLTIQRNHDLWARMEAAKRRLVYSLLNLKLPIANRTEDPNLGLAFAFLSDVAKSDGSVSKILTGHENGLITLNIAEADDAAREKIRLTMNEPYRTLLGHFRHEIGHYYWDRLVRGTEFLERYRALFGNEEADYGEALKRHYSGGAPANWQDNYISAYATSHPWEDWAETWAHFMHIQDAVEVADNFGLASKNLHVDPKKNRNKPPQSSAQKTPEEIIDAWSELAIALNSINRSMGLHDTYPFVLSPTVVNKLRFVFEVISAGPGRGAPAS